MLIKAQLSQAAPSSDLARNCLVRFGVDRHQALLQDPSEFRRTRRLRVAVSRRAALVALVIVASAGLLAFGLLAIVQSLNSSGWPQGIAFQSNVEGQDQIYVIDPAIHNITRMTPATNGGDRTPSWSADGKALAYSSGPLETEALYVLTPDGKRQITESGGDKGQPRWSPDGGTIMYYTLAKEGNEFGTLRIVHWDGTGQRPVFAGPSQDQGDCVDGFPGGWSADGRRLVYRGSVSGVLAICSATIDGSDVRILATGQDGPLSDPAVSPDGSEIVYTYHVNGHDQLYVMNIDGSHQQPLLTDSANDRNAAWSPDGSRIAFSSNMDGSNYHIYVVQADGGGLTQMTDWPGDDKWPSWSPSGSE